MSGLRICSFEVVRRCFARMALFGVSIVRLLFRQAENLASRQRLRRLFRCILGRHRLSAYWEVGAIREDPVSISGTRSSLGHRNNRVKSGRGILLRIVQVYLGDQEGPLLLTDERKWRLRGAISEVCWLLPEMVFVRR